VAFVREMFFKGYITKDIKNNLQIQNFVINIKVIIYVKI